MSDPNRTSANGLSPIDPEFLDELHRQRIRRIVRQKLDLEEWQAPPAGRSLDLARKEPPRPVRQMVPGVIPRGIVILSAQFKAGKTTLAIDLASCLRSGEPWLGQYAVPWLGGTVAYFNLEVDESEFHSWLDKRVPRRITCSCPDEHHEDCGYEPKKCRKLGCHSMECECWADGECLCGDDECNCECEVTDITAHGIVHYPLRGARLNLMDPHTEEWVIGELREHGARVWIIDPLGRMLENENDNSEFNSWLRVVERIAREARLDLVFVLHHTGHNQGDDDIPRSRGASAMMGGTDANLAYRHGGALGGYPPDNKRYLSGFGRGIDLEEITLDFDFASSRLYVAESSNGRAADAEARLADLAVTALELADDERLNRGDLEIAIGGKKENQAKAINSALKAKKILKVQEGRFVYYSLPDAKQKVTKRP
jgi:hypothetical protein